MITAITFQWMHNVKYENESLSQHHAYGDRYIKDLQSTLASDIPHITKLYAIVVELNLNLENAPINEIVYRYANEYPTVSHKTKKKRTYYWGGLTIHEEDQ